MDWEEFWSIVGAIAFVWIAFVGIKLLWIGIKLGVGWLGARYADHSARKVAEEWERKHPGKTADEWAEEIRAAQERLRKES